MHRREGGKEGERGVFPIIVVRAPSLSTQVLL